MIDLYHVNPETGNPNLCRAKKKCPFGGEADHFTTKEAAREHFEKISELSGIKSLSGLKLSKGAKLVLALDRAQQDLIDYTRKLKEQGEPRLSDEGWDARIHIRNKLLKNLETGLTWDDNESPPYDDSETIPLTTINFNGNEPRRGYSNDWVKAGPDEKLVYEQLDNASAAWLKRLSSAEVKAVVMYNRGAKEYAQATAGEPQMVEPEFIKYFHSAVEKAPRTEKPFIAYAGISAERCAAVRSDCAAGALRLDRVQSASANPAQVNGFMYQSDPRFNEWKGSDDETAIEFEVSRVASLSAFNVHRGEMEILIAPGSYEVSDTHHGIKYLWGGEDRTRESGRTAETTFKLRQVNND